MKRAALIGIALGMAIAIAREARAHEPYTEWKQPDNPSVSCCSGTDCRPTKAYLTDEGWKAWNGSKWLLVPWNKVLPTDLAGDGRNHLCERNEYIYCFSPTGPKS